MSKQIPIRNIYYLLCYAWGHMDESDVVDVASLDEFDQVHDLFGKVLAEGTFRLLKRGIDRGYLERTEDLRGVRGKLEIAQMTKRALRVRGMTACTFEELSHDVLHNQILKSSLGALLRVRDLDPKVREEVALAYSKLEGIQVIPLRRELFRRVQLDRNLRTYRFLLSICALLHDSLLVDEESGDSEFGDFRRDEHRMWEIYEGFVTEFYRREQSTYRVLGQKRLAWDGLVGRTETDAAFVPGMRPDVVLESAHRRIVLDTKFYRRPFASHFGQKLHSENLYQLMAYLHNRQAALPNGPRHEGVLLYPAVSGSFVVDVRMNGFRVQARSVDLGGEWGGIRRGLMRILSDGIAPARPVDRKRDTEVQTASRLS